MSDTHTTKGAIKLVNDTQVFGSGFQKREFVVTTEADSKYPQDIKFEVVKDKCDLLDNFAIGEEVEISFNLRGREWEGKYFTNLEAWKVIGKGVKQTAPANNDSPPTEELEGDDIPF